MADRTYQNASDAQETEMPLTESLYGELHEVAVKLMRRERPDSSLQSTILVHDAFLALRRQRNLQSSERCRLLAAAAQIMRRQLVDSARARRRQKRGGSRLRESLPPTLTVDANEIDVLELHDALKVLKSRHETTANIVEMKFFGGMTHAEIAEVTGLSERTIGEKWRCAKAWLYRAMNASCPENHDDIERLRPDSDGIYGVDSQKR
jgi:RNA polymerase sigma-70 factor, ECF subfamily